MPRGEIRGYEGSLENVARENQAEVKLEEHYPVSPNPD